MKCNLLWGEQIPKPQDPNTTLTNQVRGTAFNNDGTCTVAVVGDAILVYDSDSGQMLNKPIRGAHKDTINCVAFSKDGKRFATCGDDKSVIIFKYSAQEEPRVTAELKYQHAEEVYSLAFNPLTSQIFSGGTSDMALWTPDQGNIEKHKYKQKITCAAWSADGMTLGFGTMNGMIIFKDRKLEDKAEVARQSPVWCMDWTPITPDNLESILCVGVWDQTITLYNQNGQQVGTHRQLGFDPLSIQFYSTGEFYLLSGTHKKASLYAKEGGFLIDVCEKDDWIWNAKIRPKDMCTSIVTNDGQINQYKITPLTVHSLNKDRYASRESLTDILVQSISVNSKIRVKCKELVKNVSIYKEKLAALLNERVLIYINNSDEAMKYRLHKRINKKIQCEHFEVLGQNILISNKKKIQLLKLNGELEREWIMDASIKSLKNTGGPERAENILIGLNNGNVCQIVINNSFPVILMQHSIPIVMCDLSLDRKRLGIVDKNKNLTVYDVFTKEVVLTELGVYSCSFNTKFNDSIAYSGQDMLYIKSSNHPPLTQKYQGKIIGFQGNKIFVQDEQSNTLNTIDVSQTTTMTKFIEKKQYEEAYKIACLGITNADFKILGMEALQNMEFNIAKKCFLRIKDLEFYELVKKHEFLQENGTFNKGSLQGEVLAYKKEYYEATHKFKDANLFDQATQMWSELKMYDKARELIMQESRAQGRQTRDLQNDPNIQGQISVLRKNEANDKEMLGEWKDAAQIFLELRDYKKCIELYSSHNDLDGLMQVCRLMEKDKNKNELQTCAYQFRKHKNHQYAKEAYLKLGDQQSLVALHVEMERFEEALMLGKQDPQLLEKIKLPYANWLSRNDRYVEALQAYKQLNRHDLTTKMLQQLSQNAVIECRFDDAAVYFWILATECLKLVLNAKNPSGEDAEYLQKFKEYSDNADIYYAYNKIYQFIEEPIQPLSGIGFLLHIFNASRFAINKLQNKSLYGVKQSFIYYALGKVSKQLEGYKTARQCYEKLQFYKINPEWTEEVDLNNLIIRSKPFSDKDSLLPICNRCMNSNPVISNSYNCTTCMHQFLNSFISFENLPLVEFKVPTRITHQKVISLLYSDKSQLPKHKKKKVQDDGWSESTQNEQILNLQKRQEEGSLFLDKLNEVFEIQQTSQEYIPLELDESILASLEPDQVYWINYQKYCPSTEIRYFKCMVKDIALKNCQECGRFFFLDEFEFEYLKNKKCPFCKTLDQREGPQKDVFDIGN